MRRRRLVVVVTLACALLVIVGGAALMLNPGVANHFGYALPGDAGLPSRVAYAGRDYAASGQCLTSAQLQQNDWWPLHQVSHIPTVLGPARPLFTDTYPQGHASTTMMLFTPKGSCYAVYVIEGGP